MSTILIAYYSRTGHTKEMAQKIAEGARETGAQVELASIENVKVETLKKYAAIVLGSPDYYGTMAAQVKKLLDDSVQLHGELAGKVGGAFASAATIGGGGETTVLSMIQGLLVHGMIVAGMAAGDHYGPISLNAPDDRSTRQCHSYGVMIAGLVKRIG